MSDSHKSEQRKALAFPPVQDAESGQKLLNFLQRRLALPPSLLHRWLRTGQIRLNGRRCKPFERICGGDIVRLPPFALALVDADKEQPVKMADLGDGEIDKRLQEWQLPPLLGKFGDVWALNKSAGLPVHGGTGHLNSLGKILKQAFADTPFPPTPAHRLDMETSGVLLLAASYSALRLVQDHLRNSSLIKEYVCWISDRWPNDGIVELRGYLARCEKPGQPPMRMAIRGERGAREAISIVKTLKMEKGKSLLQVSLLTGRKHQIRAQLAALGHPVLGDRLYGKVNRGENLMLHSLRAALPGHFEIACAPPWPDWPFDELPPIICRAGNGHSHE